MLELIGYAMLALVCLGCGLYAVGLFNDLVRMRSRIDQAFANVDVVIKQRHDEIPRLVEICRGYMNFEASVLERVTGLRNNYQGASGVDAKVLVENQIQFAFAAIPAIVEAYPELKANDQFIHLQTRLTEVETAIADRRELYNQATTYYNTALKQFPPVVLARLFRFRRRPLFELADPQEAAVPSVEMAAR